MFHPSRVDLDLALNLGITPSSHLRERRRPLQPAPPLTTSIFSDLRQSVSAAAASTSLRWNKKNVILCHPSIYEIVVPSKNGTSSLSKHYRLSCKKKPGSSGVNQSPAVSNKRVIGSQELKPFNEEETRRELAMMVVLHDYPLSMVEHVGFRRFVASFQSSFQMISRNTLKNDIMKIYGDEKTKCYKALEKLKCRIAITTDMWTSGNNKKGFMVIIGHYIDDSWVLQSCILRVKHQEKYYKDLPTDEDWVNAIEICAKLKFFYRATEMFSGTLYLTANIYFPIISNIKVKLNEWVKSPNWMIQYMADKMLEKYDKYWETCHIMMAVAAVLDPRYKMVSVEFYFQRIYGEQSQSLGVIGSTIRGGATDASTDDSLDDEYDLFVASRSAATASLKSELDVYLEESVLPRTQNLDVLIASESAFSTSGRLLSPHRNRLHSLTVEALMCSRSWLWKEANGYCSL
ncbi:hypothetical protein BUALT_Bualt02G0186900 [Buddleja alternifolia]|uniref:Uncharacterized protein n=1 Tax=Buddleja alternifolia TaxID=168488 RepID=A0AAV6Y8H9_9LAMI|nr:hypothetical protein BUALT_Bualt02G0186900 [Buddleja alternifolia]